MAKFKKGQSGNPKGRPKGIQDRRSQFRGLIDEHVPGVIDKVVSTALDGDMAACKLLLDKVLPSLRPTVPSLSLPEFGKDIATESEAIVRAMLSGSLSPEQATAAVSVLTDHARLCEHMEVQTRLETLEAKFDERTD